MFNFIEGFFKVKLENEDFLVRVMTEVKVFKGPCKAVLNISVFDEPILVPVNKGNDDILEPVGQKLGDEFHGTIE